MATIRERARKNGTIAYTVLWRAGGTRTGKQESEILGTRKKAELFQGLVDLNGQQWPPGWVRGEGFVEQPAAVGKDMPFTQWAHRVVDRLNGIEERTRGDYHRDIDRHLSLLAHTEADGRTVPASVANTVADDIADWVRAEERGERDPEDPEGWLRRPAKPKSIANRHSILYFAFQAAMEADPPLRTTNPCAKTKLPRRDDGTEDEMVFLEHDEYQRLRAEIAKICGGDAVDLTDILVGTGLRWGEATALQAGDLSLRGATPTLRVQRAWKRQDDGTFKLGPPKTKKARRTIALTPDQVAILQRLIVGKPHDGYVFLTTLGKVWRHSNFFYRRWTPAVKEAVAKGLPRKPRPHDLRHTHVAWLIAAKIPLPAIQARLGHESITTTVDRYGHLVRALDGEISAAVQAAMAAPAASGLRLVELQA